MEEQYLNIVKKLFDYDIEDVKIMVEIAILNKKLGTNYKNTSQSSEISLSDRVILEENIKSLEARLDMIKSERNEIKEKYYVLKSDLQEEYSKKREENEKKMEERIKYYQEQMNNIISTQDSIVETRVKEKMELLKDKVLVQCSKIQTLEETVLEKQNKIDELEKKYILSSKGKTYEVEIYNNLKNIIEEKHNNIWRITHVGSKLGSKGDIILEHRIDKIKIMIDPKNHNKVDASHRNKFLSDMKNPNNYFNAGIMLSRGMIDTKQSFDKEIIGNKRLYYISYYQIGNEDFLMSQLEAIRQELTNDENSLFNSRNVQKKYLLDYNELKHHKQVLEKECKFIENKLTLMSKEYENYFDGDIEVDIVNKSNIDSQIDEATFIVKFCEENIKPKKGDFCKVTDIHKEVVKVLPSIKIQEFTKHLNGWKLSKFNDKKKLTSRSTLVGYQLG